MVNLNTKPTPKCTLSHTQMKIRPLKMCLSLTLILSLSLTLSLTLDSTKANPKPNSNPSTILKCSRF